MKTIGKMSNEELLVKFECLMIRFVKEDDFGLNTDKTNEEIEDVKAEIFKRMKR